MLGLHRQTLEPFVHNWGRSGPFGSIRGGRCASGFRYRFSEAKSFAAKRVQKNVALVVLWTFQNSALAIAGERV